MFLRINLIKISIRIINRTKNGIPKPSPRPKPFFENELLNNNRNEEKLKYLLNANVFESIRMNFSKINV